jgi:hypothetical protein
MIGTARVAIAMSAISACFRGLKFIFKFAADLVISQGYLQFLRFPTA